LQHTSMAAAATGPVGAWGTISRAVVVGTTASTEFVVKVAKAPGALVTDRIAMRKNAKKRQPIMDVSTALAWSPAVPKPKAALPPMIRDRSSRAAPSPKAELSPVTEASTEFWPSDDEDEEEENNLDGMPESDSVRTLIGPLDIGMGTLVLEEEPGLALPRMIVRTEKKPISDASVRAFFSAMDVVLARGRPFTAVYDLRKCSLPSRKQIAVGQEWGHTNHKALNALLQGIAIINASTLMRSTVNMILAVRPLRRRRRRVRLRARQVQGGPALVEEEQEAVGTPRDPMGPHRQL